MAAEGNEFEGVLRDGSRCCAAVDVDERDDSEGYVFVERRESDESSLEDLHVVEGPDRSGDESSVEHDGQNSESFVQILGGGDASGDEEPARTDMNERFCPVGNSSDEQADLCKRNEDRSLTCDGEEEEVASEFDAGSHQDPPGDHGVVDGHVEASGDSYIKEQGDAGLETYAEPDVETRQLSDASLGSCSAEEDKVVSGPPEMTSVDLSSEIVGGQNLRLNDTQKAEEQADPSSVEIGEFTPEKEDYGSKASVESANELGSGFVAEVQDPRSVPLSEQDREKPDEYAEDHDDDKTEEPKSADMEAPAVSTKVFEDETYNNFKNSSNLEYCTPKEDNVEDEVSLHAVAIYSDTVKSREVRLGDGRDPKERTRACFEFETLKEEPSRKVVVASVADERADSEPDNGAATVLALQQGPLLKDEEHEAEANMGNTTNVEVGLQKLAESMTVFSCGPTDQEPDDIAIQPPPEFQISRVVKIENEGIPQVVTHKEPYPDSVNSRDILIKSDQSPRELTESGTGTTARSIEIPFTEDDDKISPPPPNITVEGTNNAVMECPLKVPEREPDNAAKLPSNLNYSPFEGNKSVAELETVLAKTDDEPLPEVFECKELGAYFDPTHEEEKAKSGVRFPTLDDEALEEKACSSGKDEDLVTGLNVWVQETSGLNQTDLRNRGDDRIEAMEDLTIQEQKNSPLAVEMTCTSKQDLKDTVRQSSECFPSKVGKDSELSVFGMKVDKDVEGESEGKVNDSAIEHFEIMHIPDSSGSSALDAERSCQVSYQSLSSQMLPCDSEIESVDGNSTNDIRSNPAQCEEQVSEAHSFGGNFVLTDGSIDDICDVISQKSEIFTPEAESIVAPTDCAAASNVLIDDSSACETTNATSTIGSVATTNSVESANQNVSAVVEPQGHDSHMTSEEVQHGDENLPGQEKQVPVVQEERPPAPEEDARSLGIIAKLEPVDSSEELDDVSQNESIFPAQVDGTTQECMDNTTDYAAKESPISFELRSEDERKVRPDEEHHNLLNSQDQCSSKDDNDKVKSKDDCSIEDANENSAAHSAPIITDGTGRDLRFYIVRVRRNQDDKLSSQIEQAQLQVEEKTQNRDAIREMIQRKKLVCEELWKDVEDMRKVERAARQTIDAKYHELKAIRDTTSMIELVYSIDEYDVKINSLQHRMQHETIPLKEEKQLMQHIKQLKHKREDLSSKLAPQAEMQKVFEQKDQIEDHLKRLMPELDYLKKELSHRELKAKAAKKKYDDETLVLRNLQAQHRAADELRQEAYTHLRNVRKELNEKNMHFYKYKDGARAATSIANSGDKEALRSHCNNQIEMFMALWNNNDEFRKHYVSANQFSTVRRFGTLDGRSLGPDEEPVTFINSPVMADTVRPLKSDSAQILDKKQGKGAELPISEKCDKPVKVMKTSKSDKQSKSSETKPEDATASVSTEESKTEDAERERRKTEEAAQKRMADELAGLQEEEKEKEQEAKRKQQEAAIKEKIRLEQIAKAKEAEERKRRKVDKAKALAEMRAQREMELKEKKRAKKERLKEKKASVSADATRETNEGTEVLPSTPPEAVEIPEKKDERSLTAASKQQHYGKKTPLPPPLRNRGKRKLQTWIWVLIGATLVGLLVLLGNSGFLRRLHSRGF